MIAACFIEGWCRNDYSLLEVYNIFSSVIIFRLIIQTVCDGQKCYRSDVIYLCVWI